MFYVLDENNNKIEAFDKEGVVAAIEEAAKNGTLESLVADTGFIKKLKCCVTGGTSQVAFVTMAKYNELKALGLLIENTAYFITDDNTFDHINETVIQINKNLNGILQGVTTVPKAANVTETINGKLISEIFEADGVTAKKAKILSNVESNRGTSLGIAVWYSGIYVVVIKIKPTDSSLNNGNIWYETTVIAIPDMEKEAWAVGASHIKYSNNAIWMPTSNNYTVQDVWSYKISDINKF